MKWEKVKLEDICINIKSGGTPLKSKASYYSPGTINWLKTKEVNYCRIYTTENFISNEGSEKSSAKVIPENSVIMAMYGQGDTAGRVAINKIPLATNQACCNLITNPNRVDYEYLYYKLCTLYEKLVSLKNGGAQPNLSVGLIKKVEIDLPDLNVQRKIASVLSSFDDLIENNQKQIKLLEEAAQRLYMEWFVDLRFPGHEKVKIVDGVPEGWELLPVGELIAKVTRTKQVATSEMIPSGKIPVVDQSKKLIAGYTNDEDTIVRCDSPVIVFGDHTRILKYIQFPFAKGADGTQLIVSNNARMPQCLFYCSLVNVDLSNYSYARHYKYLKQEVIRVPSEMVADDFSKIVTAFFENVDVLRNRITYMEEARDRLLTKLMSGELEVE